MSFGLRFHVDTKGIEKAFAGIGEGRIVAVIYNDAKSADGTFYWRYVNDGRGPIRPVKAKVLHWVDPETGKDVFAMYAGPSAPRHIREKAMPAIRAGGFAAYAKAGHLSREVIVQFVNNVALSAVAQFQIYTPVRSGKLKSSYKVNPAS